MMIHADKCAELGLIVPKTSERQFSYVLRLMRQGGSINTRQARFIGIGNLHSIASQLKNKGYKFNNEKKAVICPFTGEFYPCLVCVLSMKND